MLGQCWDNVGTMLGQCWDNAGTMLGPAGTILGHFIMCVAKYMCFACKTIGRDNRRQCMHRRTHHQRAGQPSCSCVSLEVSLQKEFLQKHNSHSTAYSHHQKILTKSRWPSPPSMPNNHPWPPSDTTPAIKIYTHIDNYQYFNIIVLSYQIITIFWLAALESSRPLWQNQTHDQST